MKRLFQRKRKTASKPSLKDEQQPSQPSQPSSKEKQQTVTQEVEVETAPEGVGSAGDEIPPTSDEFQEQQIEKASEPAAQPEAVTQETPKEPPTPTEMPPKEDEFYPVVLLAAAHYLNERKQKQMEEQEKEKLKKKGEEAAEKKKEKREKKEKEKAEEAKKEAVVAPPIECYTEYTEVTKCIPNICPDPLGRPKSLGTYPLVTTRKASRPAPFPCPEDDIHPVPPFQGPRAKQCPQRLRPNSCLPPPARERDFRVTAIDGCIWLFYRWHRMNFMLKYVILMLILLWNFNWRIPDFLPRSFPLNLFIVLYLDANVSCFKFIPGFLFLLVPLENTGTFIQFIKDVLANAFSNPLPFVLLVLAVLFIIYWLAGWPCRRELTGGCNSAR